MNRMRIGVIAAGAALLVGPGMGAAAGRASPPAAPAQPAAFATCTGCHNVAKGAPSEIGPNLYGVVGRKAGALPDYAYSASLKNSGAVWNRRTLDQYLANTKSVAPAGKMPNVNLNNPADRAAIITYLSGLK